MKTTYPAHLVCKKTIICSSDEEPSFDMGALYEIMGVDEKMDAYIVLSEWGEATAIRKTDSRFHASGEVEGYRDSSILYVGASVKGKWIWVGKTPPLL